MILSIITINLNNAIGLEKTMASVLAQTSTDFEYVVVDGASTDGSVDVIQRFSEGFGERMKWISESDAGIYSAMNKGIRFSSGKYCQFLNSGDVLASKGVVECMINKLEENKYPDIFYGKMKKVKPDGSSFVDGSGAKDDVTLNMFYRGSLNHSPAFIRRSLFDEYGMYDESLQICSDWKFYMQSIVLGHATVCYVDLMVTIFDMTGISEKRKDILEEERNRLLYEMVPQRILKDYEKYHFPVSQYNRLKRHHLWGVVSFAERVLFKLEKWHVLK